MKIFKITSPAYKSNGLNGIYFSVAFTDDEGNVIKGFGDHISDMSYGIKNVFKSEGESFSDEGRFISIEEVLIKEEDFDVFVKKYTEFKAKEEEFYKKRVELFGHSVYDYIYNKKEGQEERRKEVENFDKENKVDTIGYYDFVGLVNELPLKSREDIVKEYNKNDSFKIENIHSPSVDKILDFYRKYPRYRKLESFAVSLIQFTLDKGNKIKVYRWKNGDLMFKGYFFSEDNYIAGIGGGLSVGSKSWEELEECGIVKLVEILK